MSRESFLHGEVYRAMVGPRGAEVNLSFRRSLDGKEVMVAFSPSCSGRSLAIYTSGTLSLWELEDRGELANARTLWESSPLDTPLLVEKLLFSEDGKWLLCTARDPESYDLGTTSLLLWKEGAERSRGVQGGSQLFDLLLMQDTAADHFYGIAGIDMSPDGKWLAIAANMVESYEEVNENYLYSRVYVLETQGLYEALRSGRRHQAQEIVSKEEEANRELDQFDGTSWGDMEDEIWLLSKTNSLRFLGEGFLAVNYHSSTEVFVLEGGKWKRRTTLTSDLITDESEMRLAGGRLFLVPYYGKTMLASPTRLGAAGETESYLSLEGVDLAVAPNNETVLMQKEHTVALLDPLSLRERMYWDKQSSQRTSFLFSRASCGSGEEILVNADHYAMAFWDTKKEWEYLGTYKYPNPIQKRFCLYKESAAWRRPHKTVPNSWSVSSDGKWLVSVITTERESELLAWDLEFIRSNEKRNISLWHRE